MKNKLGAKAVTFMAGLCAALTSFVPVHADEATVDSIWNSTFSNVAPIVTKFVLPAALLAVGAMVIGAVVRSYMDYKRTGEINWVQIIVLFAVLAVLITFNAKPDLLWQLVGLK